MLQCERSRVAAAIRFTAIVGLVLCSCAHSFAAESDRSSQLVVVLYPQNNDGSPGNFFVDQSIRAVIAEEAPRHVEIYNEYLDITSSAGGGNSQLQRDYLTKKYAGRRVDVVIAGLSSALDFVLKHRDIFSGAPVVFCAVEEREVHARALPSDVIGFPVRFDLKGTLDLALRLHPRSGTVAVVAGSAPMDRAWEEYARSIFDGYDKSVHFRYLTGLPLDELIDEIGNLPRNSLVYYLHVFNDGTGRTFVPARVLQTLARYSHVPIYGHVDTYVGNGIVGGRVFSFDAEGRNAARLALRILAGESPEEIGVQKITNTGYMFDDRQLRNWRISKDDLPEESVVRYAEPVFWQVYKWRILAVGLVCVLQSVLIAGLLAQRARRRSAEESVRTSQRELQQLSNSLIGAQENERRRIARELHDDFNQRLALLSVELDLFRQRPPGSAEEVRRRIGELSDQVRELSTSIHDLSHDLHPLKLEQLGLVKAVRGLCQEVARNHELHVQFQAAECVPDAIPSEMALCLYRIVQEALRNVIRHSQSTEASVQIASDPGEIRVTIEDQGTGFVSSTASSGGLGLISMRERLRLVHGELTIDSRPPEGTRIEVRVPLPVESPEGPANVQLVTV